MRIRWRVDGVIAPPRPAGVPRDHQGVRDAIANPAVGDPAVAGRLLSITPGPRRAGVGGWRHLPGDPQHRGVHRGLGRQPGAAVVPGPR
jgi:deferrochelatase/peroxidase EfeB